MLKYLTKTITRAALAAQAQTQMFDIGSVGFNMVLPEIVMDCYIIGTGRSLEYLTEGVFGKGIIIALNRSIEKINELHLPENTIFGMVKDGAGLRHGNRPCDVPCSECPKKYSLPKDGVLLVHKHTSINCFRDYPMRIIFDNLELGLKKRDFSALSAIKLAKMWGATMIHMVSFDSVTEHDCLNVMTGKMDKNYLGQHRRLYSLLSTVDHDWIEP